MVSFSLFQRTLKRALDIVGDEQRLARRLRVPIKDLQEWLMGEHRPPTWVFLCAVDVVAVGGGDVRPVAYERRRKPRQHAPHSSPPH